MADDQVAIDSIEVDEEVEQEYDDDAAMRAQAAVNSPKGDNGMTFNDDDENDNNENGMSLNLGDDINDEDENEYNPANSTPNTKFRNQADVNSPRAKTKQKWGSDETDSSAAVAGLMTQVSRQEAANQQQPGSGGVVSREDDDTERNIKDAQQQPSGICACFSCLWSCCSSPQNPASVEMNDSKTAYNNQASNNPSTKKAEGSDATLLGSSEGNTMGDREDSVSSTDYSHKLLPPLKPEYEGKKCLVLDLDETLVHSSFKPIPKPDFIIPVEIDRVVHHVYVLKRPFVDEFLLRASKCYEIVIFTASLSKYADPLLDKLDIHNVIQHRLFRESCVIHGTAYVKDMKRIGRKLKDTIIVDNSPPSYLFQPCNAVPIASWFDDQTDTQLKDFCPVIETTMKDIDDVRKLLDANQKSFRWLCNQANQPLSKYTVRNDRVNRQQ